MNIDQDIDFAIALATLNGMLHGVGRVRWSRSCSNVSALPGPFDLSSALLKINKLQYKALKLDVMLLVLDGSVVEWLYCPLQTHPDGLLFTSGSSTSLTNSIDNALVFRSFAFRFLVRRAIGNIPLIGGPKAVALENNQYS